MDYAWSHRYSRVGCVGTKKSDVPKDFATALYRVYVLWLWHRGHDWSMILEIEEMYM